VFLLSPRLLTSAILGVDFFINTCTIIDFPERCALFKVDDKTTKQLFEVTIDAPATINGNVAAGCKVLQVTSIPHKTFDPPLIEAATDLEHREFDSETDVVPDKDGSTGCCYSYAKCTDVRVHFDEFDTTSRSLRVLNDAVAADFSQGMEKESSVPISSIVGDNEGHRDGELICEYDSENGGIIAHATPKTAVNCFRTTTGNTFLTVSTKIEAPADRVITSDKLRAKISEYDDLNEIQRDRLIAVLTKYQPHLTKRPGKCNGYEYHFNILGKSPEATSSRTI